MLLRRKYGLLIINCKRSCWVSLWIRRIWCIRRRWIILLLANWGRWLREKVRLPMKITKWTWNLIILKHRRTHRPRSSFSASISQRLTSRRSSKAVTPSNCMRTTFIIWIPKLLAGFFKPKAIKSIQTRSFKKKPLRGIPRCSSWSIPSLMSSQTIN